MGLFGWFFVWTEEILRGHFNSCFCFPSVLEINFPNKQTSCGTVLGMRSHILALSVPSSLWWITHLSESTKQPLSSSHRYKSFRVSGSCSLGETFGGRLLESLPWDFPCLFHWEFNTCHKAQGCDICLFMVIVGAPIHPAQEDSWFIKGLGAHS